MKDSSYLSPFIFACIFHIIVVLFFVLQIKKTSYVNHSAQANIIKAVVFNEQAINQYKAQIAVQKATQQEAQLKQYEQQLKAQQEAQLRAQQILQQKLAAEVMLKEVQQKAQALKAQQLAKQKTVQEIKKQTVEEKTLSKKQKVNAEKNEAVVNETKQIIPKPEKTKAKVKSDHAKQLQQQLANELTQQLEGDQVSLNQNATQLNEQQGIVDKYKALIVQSISQHWIVPEHLTKDLACQLAIRVAPGGNVLGVKLVKSSGDPILDRSAIAAVYKASPLPVPADTRIFDKFRDLRLTVRPDEPVS